MENLEYIRERLTCRAQLEQLAEEACELGQAALKMIRVLHGESPTPTTYNEATAKLVEETADVLLALEVLRIYPDTESVNVVRSEKMDRWAERLKAKEGEA